MCHNNAQDSTGMIRSRVQSFEDFTPSKVSSRDKHMPILSQLMPFFKKGKAQRSNNTDTEPTDAGASAVMDVREQIEKRAQEQRNKLKQQRQASAF